MQNQRLQQLVHPDNEMVRGQVKEMRKLRKEDEDVHATEEG